jgi:MFS family permease
MLLVPIMPFYLEQLGTSSLAESQTWAGVAIAAPALVLIIATPVWGRVGDRFGRKWMIVRSLLGLALAMVVMSMAATPIMLVAGRLLQGMFGGVVEAATAFAASTGTTEKRGSSLGRSFSATAAGALAGPIAGGLLVDRGGLRELMLMIALAAILLAMCCAVGLREPERHSVCAESDGNHTRRSRPRTSAMRVPAAGPLALAAVASYFGIYGLIPIFAEHVRGVVVEQGTASTWVGVLHSVMWSGALVGSFWWGKHNEISQRPLRSFAIAAGGCSVSIAVLGLPLDPIALIPIRLVQGFCFAALAQSLFLHFSNHAPDEKTGSFVGAANSFLLIGQSAGPLLAGPMVALMPVGAAITVLALACALGCMLAVGAARAEEHRDPDEKSDSDQQAQRVSVGVSDDRNEVGDDVDGHRKIGEQPP